MRAVAWAVSLAALIVLFASVAPSSAAISPPPVPPLHVAVVQYPAETCAEHCTRWLAIQGGIVKGAADQVRRVLHALGPARLPVLVSSQGGWNREAETIGRMIRARGLDVEVRRTLFVSCPDANVPCASPKSLVEFGVPSQTTSVCASACTLILAGGVRRIVSSNAAVGVHQSRFFFTLHRTQRFFRTTWRVVDGRKVIVSTTLVSEKPVSTTTVERRNPKGGYDEMGAYFRSMGIAPDLLTLAESALPNAMHWLKPDELRQTRMATEISTDAVLVSPPAQPATVSVGTAEAPEHVTPTSHPAGSASLKPQ